jgi:hypothetical protein
LIRFNKVELSNVDFICWGTKYAHQVDLPVIMP